MRDLFCSLRTLSSYFGHNGEIPRVRGTWLGVGPYGRRRNRCAAVAACARCGSSRSRSARQAGPAGVRAEPHAGCDRCRACAGRSTPPGRAQYGAAAASDRVRVTEQARREAGHRARPAWLPDTELLAGPGCQARTRRQAAAYGQATACRRAPARREGTACRRGSCVLRRNCEPRRSAVHAAERAAECTRARRQRVPRAAACRRSQSRVRVAEPPPVRRSRSRACRGAQPPRPPPSRRA